MSGIWIEILIVILLILLNGVFAMVESVFRLADRKVNAIMTARWGDS